MVVVVRPASSCRLFDGSLDKDGYGVITWTVMGPNGKRVQRAHRLAFLEANGYLPPVVRHSCDNPPCIEATHLLGGSQLENIADRNTRGRTSRGERHSTARLTEAQVHEIRSDPRIHRLIAADYDICSSHVSRIKLGKQWAVTPV